ncbi:NAD(P)H-quinone oxidoreductase subunit O, chloroplastic [Phoenix dactylifera]|uniref:NAD(P)H-quinone oxidoreductase subunit O, chloroplastic n=1 Tax=Phoenix dactylifera TaxID=42345 RepID=A0A8B9ATN0_PHODC|nr:NAD(P)H-quinone oxidoreductase subunit O, chloroplastic [Phoenix dactylifera]
MASMASLLSSSSSLFSRSSADFFPLAAKTLVRKPPTRSAPWIRAASSAEPEKEKLVQTPTEVPPSPVSSPKPKKPEYSMKKGQIVRVDKEKYLNSINYLSVGHPPHYKGLDYIYEDRGEVLDVRIFETGEHALVAWVGIPTPPAWLPTYMLIKSEKLNYERI